MKFKIILLALLFFCNFSLLADQPDEKLHKSCLYPTIIISNHKNFGSATIIKSIKVTDTEFRNMFITCDHVINNDSQPYEVSFFVYEDWSIIKKTLKFPAEIYFGNKKNDLAIGFFISDQEMPVAEIDFNSKVYIGSEVFRIGCGLMDEPRLDYGKITLIKTSENLIRTSIFTVPGDSGSGLFHNYKIIGITHSIRTRGELPFFDISYYIPINKLKENKEFEFIWQNKELPKMPFYKLNLMKYEFINK